MGEELVSGVHEQISVSPYPSSTTHNSREGERTQESISIGIDKQNMGYSYKGLLPSPRKEGRSEICYNKDEPLKKIMLSEQSQTPKGKYVTH
jgi:hypothetical protein